MASSYSDAVKQRWIRALALSAPPPSYDPFSGPTVEFHITAQGATEWNWDFGDGSSTGWVSYPATGANPVHTYTELGQYTVRVAIRNWSADRRSSNRRTGARTARRCPWR